MKKLNKKQQRNILIAVAILLLLYFWWENTKIKTKTTTNGNNQCNNKCCNSVGGVVMPSSYPDCRCPQTNFILTSENECVAHPVIPTPVIGCMDLTATNFNASATIHKESVCNYPVIPTPVIGCMDILATNFNPSATIDDHNSCLYGQLSHDCYTNCGALNTYQTLNTTATCGTGNVIGYPNTSPPTCIATPTPVARYRCDAGGCLQCPPNVPNIATVCPYLDSNCGSGCITQS